ncbi:MAG TPA: hypothetical protein VLA13_07510 [Massilibacterium sp.]|nr:hypothetical protein [Massilibacterium sp.]
MNLKSIINEKSVKAGLTMPGFRSKQIKHESIKLFEEFNGLGDILFVNAYKNKEIDKCFDLFEPNLISYSFQS